MPDLENDKKGLILVIDDEEHVRRVQRLLLEEFGYSVIEAENGRLGIDEFRDHQPDLIMVDLRMPELDGLGVLKIVTAESPDTPVIIVSGAGVMTDAIQAIRHGAWDYLMKPTKPSVMLHTLEKTLDRSRLIKQNKAFRRQLESQFRKIKEDEEAGRKIQAKLLPPKEWESGPYVLRQTIHPSMYLSGDFVDFFDINPNTLAFYCADISGHGVSSALVTVFLKSFIVKFRERYLHEEDTAILNPAALMNELNKELLREEIDKHMTLFYGVINTETNQLTFCNAGHFPYPLLSAGGEVNLIERKGMAIGLFPFATYENFSQALPDEFRLTVFSDGILDILSQDDLDDKVDFLKEIQTEDDIEMLFAKADGMDELPDDITVLSIEKRGV